MRSDSTSRPTALLQVLALAVVLAAALVLSWHPLEDLDIWFHDRAGADLLAHGPLPATNQYSFTEPGRPWLNHEWLFQLMVRLTGPAERPVTGEPGGWNLLRVGLTCALGLLLVLGDGGLRRLRGQGSALGAARSGLVLLGAFALLWPRLLLRPELLSYLALVLLVRWSEDLREAVRRKGAKAVDLRAVLDPRAAAGRVTWLVWLWAQCHGFSAAAPVVVVLGLVAFVPGDGFRLPPRVAWRAAGAMLSATLTALLATPNGWQGLVFPLRAIGQFQGGEADLRRTIAELTPLLATPDALHTTILLFKLSLVTGTVLTALGWRRIGALRIVLWVAMALAALASQRALGPYAVAFALLGLRAGWPERWRLRAPGGALPSFLLVGGLVAAVVVPAFWWLLSVRADRFYLAEGVARRAGGGLATALYPVAAGASLASGPPLRVFANLGASGYLLGTTPSELYIDGRTEAYSTALWREYLSIRQGGEHALALLDARRVEAVCLAAPAGPFARLAEDLLSSHRWRLEAADGGGLLMRRASLAPGPDAASGLDEAKRETLRQAAVKQQQASTVADLSDARAADALVAAATLYRLAGDDADRRTCLEQAVAREPRDALARHNLGNLEMAEGRFEAALDQFRAAARANARLAGSRLNAGVCLMRLGRAPDAVPWFEAVTHLDARSVEGWADLAVARNASGNKAGALAAVERALVLSPGNAQLSALRENLRRGGSGQ